MDWTSPFFYTLISSGPLFLITGWILMKFPPQNINGIYGYRTPRSMKSQARWDFAQKYSGRELIKCGIILTLMSFIGLFVAGAGSLLAIVLTIIAIVIIFTKTENQLNDID